jgi:hypothetical protein
MCDYLQSPSSADFEFVRDESVAYNDLCHETNARLSAVAELIDHGLREDALQLAAVDGDLLRLFELLDFPQREHWVAWVASLALQPPPDLDYESATKLNAAHAKVAELAPLMKRHRMLNLARASVRKRIAALQALHVNDSENPIWIEDAATLQLLRVEQIREELQQAIDIDDDETFRALVSEVKQTQWWIELPSKLKSQLAQGKKHLDDRAARQQLQTQIDQLQNAYAAFDIPAATACAELVRTTLASMPLSADDPIVYEASPALAWVDEQAVELAEQRRAAGLIGRLEEALDRGADRDTIALALAAAEGLGDRLPRTLRQRSRERLDSFEMVTRRKSMMMIVAATLALAAIGGSVAWFVMHQKEGARIADLETTFTELLDQQRFEEADRFFDSLDGPTRARAVFLAGKQTITQQLTVETERAGAFAEVLAELEADTSTKPNYALLTRLRNLAKTQDEQTKLALQEAIAEDRRLLEKQASGATSSAELEELQQSIDHFFDSELMGEQRFQRLRQLQTETATLVVRLNSMSPELASVATQLGKLLDAENVRLTQTMQRDNAINEITNAVGDQSRFLAELKRFAETQPDDPMSVSLKDLPEDAFEIEKSAAWIAVIADAAMQNPASVDASVSTRWLSRFEQAEQIAPQHPFSSRPRAVLPHMQSIVQRPQAIATITSISQSNLLLPMYVYTQPETNAQFYSPLPPDRNDAKAHVVDYYADTLLLERTQNFGVRYQDDVRPHVFLAGHSVFGKTLRDTLAELNETNFTVKSYRILDELKRIDDTKIDPIFKVLLLRKLLEAMLPASHPLSVGFESMLANITRSELDLTSNWLSPGDGDPNVVAARETASELLNDIGDWKQATEAMSLSFKTVRRPAPAPPRWIGWVSQVDGQWYGMLKSPTSVNANDDLVVVRYDQSAGGELVSIKNSQTNSRMTQRIMIDEPRALVVGLPIYQMDAEQVEIR